MDVTVAGVHVQGDEDAAAYGFGMDFAQALDNFGVGFAAEDFRKRLHYICFDRHAQAEIAEGNKAAFIVFGFGRGVDGCAIASLRVDKRSVQVIQ